MRTFFTSDTHYGHKNIIKYCGRPFIDIYKMNAEMIRRWNEAVRPEDAVFHLGDFALCGFDDARAILKQLNGRKYLVRGNHDKSPRRMSEMGFQLVCTEAWYQGWKLAHHPWRLGKGEQGLCGHVHEKWRRHRDLINVGVDVWDFRPVPMATLLGAPMDTSQFTTEGY